MWEDGEEGEEEDEEHIRSCASGPRMRSCAVTGAGKETDTDKGTLPVWLRVGGVSEEVENTLGLTLE